MANYQLLKADIDAKVYQNGLQEITGENLNAVLNAMVTTLGAGYQFIGVATPTNPGTAQTPDYKCFYLATTPGTYTNLGGLVVADGEVALLKYDSSWTKEVTGIATADQLNQLENGTQKFPVSNSSKINDVIKELYISDSSIISRISTIFIYKAVPLGGEYITGFLIRDASGSNLIDTRDAKKTEESALSLCTSVYISDGISVVIDWSKIEKNQNYAVNQVELNTTVSNLDFSPTIKSHINSSQISTLSTSVDKINDVLVEMEEHTKEFSIADVTGIKRVGYYCDINGEIKPLINAECTNRIFVNEGDLVLWSGGVSQYSGYYYGITAFDCNDNVIDTAIDNTNAQDVQYKVKPNTSYIIASARNSTHDEYRYPLTVKVRRKIEPLSKSNKIRIHFVNNGKFEVFVPNSTGRCLKHEFLRQYNIDTIGSKTLVTADVWYPSEIYLKSNVVIQGNLNFIYKLEDSVAGFENEGSHVGAGHGCEVMVSQKFFADGVEFVPTEQFNDIECDVFRIVLKANDYAIDTTLPGFRSEHALPKLDATGNPIVTAIHSYDAEYHVGNAIKCTNRLLIKRNGLKFNQLHGAMFQLQASAFSKISVGTSNFDTNNFTWNGSTFDVAAEDGSISFSPSDPQYQVNRFAKSKLLIGYGDDLCVRQEISNGIKDCYIMFAWYQEPANPRVKIYQMPVKTSAQFGSGADVFNDGDEICVKIERNIDF